MVNDKYDDKYRAERDKNPRPHGADGEFNNTLTLSDVDDHLINIAQLIREGPNGVDSVTFINGCEKRFIREFTYEEPK